MVHNSRRRGGECDRKGMLQICTYSQRDTAAVLFTSHLNGVLTLKADFCHLSVIESAFAHFYPRKKSHVYEPLLWEDRKTTKHLMVILFTAGTLHTRSGRSSCRHTWFASSGDSDLKLFPSRFSNFLRWNFSQLITVARQQSDLNKNVYETFRLWRTWKPAEFH